MTSRHSQLWRDRQIADVFSAERELLLALRFEAALAEAQASSCLISAEAASAVAKACRDFELDEEQLGHGVRRDGMIVPELVRQLRETLPNIHRDALHLRSTSQDVIDTVTVMMIGAAIDVLSSRLLGIIGQIEEIGRVSGSVSQMARTRMQRALPFTLQARLDAWCAPLRRHIERLSELRPESLYCRLAVRSESTMGRGLRSWRVYWNCRRLPGAGTPHEMGSPSWPPGPRSSPAASERLGRTLP